MPKARTDLKEVLSALDKDPDLRDLQRHLETFNVFTAIGMGSLEVRHSHFLAFLLDPGRNQGLKGSVAKELLLDALRRNPDQPEVATTEVSNWSLSGIEVRREIDHNDIRLVDNAHKIVVVIENKTFSSEHGDQLRRYREDVEKKYPDFHRLFLYLTPDADDPSDDEYISITYSDIEQDLARAVSARRESTNPELIALLEGHYFPLLRKEGLVADNELAAVAAKVYRKHKSAIDYIVTNQFQQGFLGRLVSSEPGLQLVGSTRKRVAFVPKEWEDLGLRSRNARFGWKLQFQFRYEDVGLDLVLRLESAQDDIGKKIIAAASGAGDPFNMDAKKAGQDRVFLYHRPILRAGRLDDDEPAEADTGILKEKWTEFLRGDLPAIRGAISRGLAV